MGFFTPQIFLMIMVK